MWMTTRPLSGLANRRVWHRPAGGARARESDARIWRSITHHDCDNPPCDRRASVAAPDKGSSVNPRRPANISYRHTLGVDANALYIGVNEFSSAASGGFFLNTTGYVVRKSSLLSGGPPVVTAFRQLLDPSTFVGPYTP